MSAHHIATLEDPLLRNLDKQEIDRLLEAAVTTVMAPSAPTQRHGNRHERVRPRWISTSEFVQRMQRYLVYN